MSEFAAPAPTAASEKPKTLVVDDFAIGDKIGRGRFGHVFRVKKKDSGKIYAMKVLFKKELVANNVLNQVVKEIEIQNRLKNKYILRLRFVVQDAKRLYLFTDVCEHGNLYESLQRMKRFPERLAGKYLRQLLYALTYLHQRNIMHRDIKPENLLLGNNGNLILTDFGWSTDFDSDGGRMTVCGTPDYLPPEMLSQQPHSNMTDSWTCGVLCYELIYGKAPFTGANHQETYKNIAKGAYRRHACFSNECLQFIEVSLRIDPTARYSCGELFLHPWTQAQNEAGPSVLDYDDEGNMISYVEDDEPPVVALGASDSTPTVAALDAVAKPVPPSNACRSPRNTDSSADTVETTPTKKTAPAASAAVVTPSAARTPIRSSPAVKRGTPGPAHGTPSSVRAKAPMPR